MGTPPLQFSRLAHLQARCMRYTCSRGPFENPVFASRRLSKHCMYYYPMYIVRQIKKISPIMRRYDMQGEFIRLNVYCEDIRDGHHVYYLPVRVTWHSRSSACADTKTPYDVGSGRRVARLSVTRPHRLLAAKISSCA